MKRRDGNELTHHSFHSIRVTVLNKYLINKPRNFCTPGLIFASISNIDVIPNVSREYMKKQSSYIRTIISTCSSSIDEIVSRVPVLSWKSSNKSFSIIIERKREGNRRIDLRLPQIEFYDFPDSRLLPVLPTVGHFDRIAKIDIRSSRNRNLPTVHLCATA